MSVDEQNDEDEKRYAEQVVRYKKMFGCYVTYTIYNSF